MPDALVLHPFRALLPSPGSPEAVGRRLCPPYDVIDTDDRERLRSLDEHNAVRLILPDSYPEAARLLTDWRASGALVPDQAAALYVYEEAVPDGQVQRGLLGALQLLDPEAGVVLPHENTMAGPVADRLALMQATEANLEPIFLVYPGGGAASAAVARAGEEPALREALTADGVRHRLWALRSGLAEIAEDLAPRRAVIADGHHRYATYLRYQQLARQAAGGADGPYDFGLTLLVDSREFGPAVHAIHRVIPSLPAAEAARLAAAGCAVHEVGGSVQQLLDVLARAGSDQRGPAFVIADGAGAGWLLVDPDPARLARALPAERSAAWRSLDVAVAHHLLIRDLWGLDDEERVVGYSHQPADALREAAASGGTALLLNPTPVADVTAVAAAGERMPRKSTLFTPKPASGLVIRSLRGPAAP